MNRNRAVLLCVLAALVFVLAPATPAQIVPAFQVPLAPTKIQQFVQPLPVLGNGVVVALPNDDKIELSMCEFQTQVLPKGTLVAGQVPWTSVWGYQVGDTCDNGQLGRSYLGPVIVATRGTPTEVTYHNRLGESATTNVLAYQQSVDQTLMWADPLNPTVTNPISGKAGASEGNPCKTIPQPAWCTDPTNFYDGPIAAAPHLHGGEIPAMLDGGPDAWWTYDGRRGHGFYSKGGFGDADSGRAVYTYPNGQEAAPIWFHDHTLGATRLNVYAGIAGAYMIVDPLATLPTGMTPLGLQNGKPLSNSTDATDELLIPVVLQDRIFDVNGQLLFPNAGINAEHPFWIPEFVGDTIVVNGKAWPFHNVEPKRYRFLFLNGSNARAYELYLINKASGAKGPSMYVIGTDQGYLDKPAKIDPNRRPNDKLIIMPGERYEVIIDFAGFAPGTKLLLSNTARTPYPAGGAVNGRTTGRIMEFRVGTCTSGFCGNADASYNPANNTAIRADTIVRLANPVTGTKALTPGGSPITVHKVRRLTLNEVIAAGGPIEILVNNTSLVGNPRADFKAITTEWNTSYYSELPHEGETEMWEIVNLTADAHPIHPHLVGFQLMNRQAFDVKGYTALYDGSFPGKLYIPGYGPPLTYNCNGSAPGRGVAPCTLGGNPNVNPFLVGAAMPPLPSEAGWKDTVIAYPGQVTRILVRFAPAHFANDTNANNAHYEFDPNSGHGFVWHCHIIDHEDNEMMRPFSVFANPNAGGSRTFFKGFDY